jgi:hypothetical protein
VILLPALLALLAAGAPTGADRVRCSPPQPRSLESPGAFATDLVGSLGRALDGTRQIDMTRDQTASDLIQAARRVQDDFACSARHVEPYAKSGSDVIRGAARNLAEKYRALSASLDGQLEWLRYLDSESRAGREPDPARAEALLEKGVARKDAAAQATAIAAVQGLDVVVEMRDGKPTGRLRLTRAERKKLEAAILGKFGETVRNGPGTENDFATNAAAGWYQVLSNGNYRSADAP